MRIYKEENNYLQKLYTHLGYKVDINETNLLKLDNKKAFRRSCNRAAAREVRAGARIYIVRDASEAIFYISYIIECKATIRDAWVRIYSIFCSGERRTNITRKSTLPVRALTTDTAAAAV